MRVMDQTKVSNNSGNKALHILYPEKYEDCKEFADFLKSGDPVLLDYDYTGVEDAVRIQDFLKGCIAALGGDVIQISERVYLYTPPQVSAEKLNRSFSFDTMSMFIEENQ